MRRIYETMLSKVEERTTGPLLFWLPNLCIPLVQPVLPCVEKLLPVFLAFMPRQPLHEFLTVTWKHEATMTLVANPRMKLYCEVIRSDGCVDLRLFWHTNS